MVWRRALQPARADGDVGAAGDRREQALGFLDGRGEIGVGKHHDLAQRLQQSVANAVAFAAVAGILSSRTSGASAAKARTTSAVVSREPSSTTMISADQLAP